MTRLALALLAAAALAVPVPSASATDGPQGEPCSFFSMPSDTEGVDAGVVWGGPVAASGTLTCTVQVDAYEHGTTANDAVAVSATGTGAVAVPPTYVRYAASPVSNVVLCTQFTPEGGATLYWDGNEWTTDAQSPCGSPCACDPEPLPDPFVWLVDPLVCPVLTGVQPLLADPDGPVYVAPDGDVSIAVLGEIWDCPPYLA